jgi:carboxypeptidase D
MVPYFSNQVRISLAGCQKNWANNRKGTLAPVPNSYSWTNLTNVIWIEQPVGVGYSQGTPNIRNEKQLGLQLIGFWRNFISTFEMEGATTYITGESYGG